MSNLSNFPSGYRVYSQPFNTSNGTTAFNQLYDANWVWSNGAASVTGAWRPFFPSDFASNISISGVEIVVGNVGITGAVAIASFPSTGASAAVTGTVALSQATFTPTFGFATGSQVVIPAGARAYSVWIESGSASIGGTVYNVGTSIAGGGYPNFTLSASLGVGCTGSAASPCRLNYNYEV